MERSFHVTPGTAGGTEQGSLRIMLEFAGFRTVFILLPTLISALIFLFPLFLL